MYRDVVDVVEQAGHRLDTVLIPKVGVPADVYLVDALLTQIEAGQGHPAPDRHRRADRDRARHGQRRGDRAVEPAARGHALRRRRLRRELPRAHREHRRPQPRLPGRPVARRALADDRRLPGLRPPRPSTGRSATSRIRTATAPPRGAARRSASRASGRSTPRRSRWPTRCSRPPPAEVDRARRILDALDEAARDGRGAAQLDGRMIDAASARMAQNVVQMAEAIARKKAGRPRTP